MKQIKLSVSVHTCATGSEFSSNLSTTVLPVNLYINLVTIVSRTPHPKKDPLPVPLPPYPIRGREVQHLTEQIAMIKQLSQVRNSGIMFYKMKVDTTSRWKPVHRYGNELKNFKVVLRRLTKKLPENHQTTLMLKK